MTAILPECSPYNLDFCNSEGCLINAGGLFKEYFLEKKKKKIRKERKGRIKSLWKFIKLIHSHNESSAALLSAVIHFHINGHIYVTHRRDFSLVTGRD